MRSPVNLTPCQLEVPQQQALPLHQSLNRAKFSLPAACDLPDLRALQLLSFSAGLYRI
jgi:hypothetical protein